MFRFFRKKPQREPIEHPDLGLLEPGDGDCWNVRVELGGATVTLSIDGEECPEEQALTQALTLVREAASFAERVAAFLREESASPHWRPPDAGVDHSETIAALRIESVFIRSDGAGLIYFNGPGHFAWRCEMKGGVPRGLGFDS